MSKKKNIPFHVKHKYESFKLKDGTNDGVP